MALVPQLVEITNIDATVAMNLLVATNNNLAESINLALAMDSGGPSSGDAVAAQPVQNRNTMSATNYQNYLNDFEDMYAGSGMELPPGMMSTKGGGGLEEGSDPILNASERERRQLQEAIRLSEAANGGTASSVHESSSSSSLPQPSHIENASSRFEDEDEDGVRKADSVKRQRLLPEGMSSTSYSHVNIHRNSNSINVRTRRRGDPGNPFGMADGGYDHTGAEQKNAAEKQKMVTISNLFKPPTNLCVQGDLAAARELCEPLDFSVFGSRNGATGDGNHYKWLLVNIQYPTEWACHVLNRDVWKNMMVIEIVRGSFKLWQQVYEPPASSSRLANQNLTEAQMFVDRYRLSTSSDSFPFIGILDPRTGLLVWRYEGHKKSKKRTKSEKDSGEWIENTDSTNNHNIVQCDQFIERLMEFITENPYPGYKDITTAATTATGTDLGVLGSQQSMMSEAVTELPAETQTQLDTQLDKVPRETYPASRTESTTSVTTTTSHDSTISCGDAVPLTQFFSSHISNLQSSKPEFTSSPALKIKFIFPPTNTGVVCNDLRVDSTVLQLLQWALPHLQERISPESTDRLLFDIQYDHPAVSLHERVRRHLANNNDADGDILQHITTLRLSDLKITGGRMRVVLP